MVYGLTRNFLLLMIIIMMNIIMLVVTVQIIIVKDGGRTDVIINPSHQPPCVYTSTLNGTV